MDVNSDIFWVISEIAIIIIAIFLRAHIGFKTKIGQDTWAHLLVADIIRQKKQLPETIDNFIYEGPYGYPPFLHILLARLPQKLAEKYAWIFSGVIDSVHIIILALFCYYLTSNPTIAVLASFMFAISWIMVRESMSLNTRPLGSLIFTCSLIPIIFYSLNHDIYLAIIGVFFGILLMFTHKLASQALFFTLLGFAIIELNPIYVIFAGCIFIGAIIVPGGGYLKRILPEHIAILVFWQKHMDQYHAREAHVYNPNFNNNIRSKLLFFADIIKKIIAYSYWMLFVMAAILLLNVHLSGIELKLLIWILIIFACFIAFDFIPSLKLLGEGSRYLETGLFPAIILSSVFVVTNYTNILIDAFFITCILASLIIVYFHQSNIQKLYHRIGLNSALRDIFECVKNGKKEGVICIPYNFSFMAAYFTRKKVFYAFSALAYEKAYPEALFGSPIDKPLDELIKKYNINYVIVDTSYFNLHDLKLGSYTSIMEKDQYALLEIS